MTKDTIVRSALEEKNKHVRKRVDSACEVADAIEEAGNIEFEPTDQQIIAEVEKQNEKATKEAKEQLEREESNRKVYAEIRRVGKQKEDERRQKKGWSKGWSEGWSEGWSNPAFPGGQHLRGSNSSAGFTTSLSEVHLHPSLGRSNSETRGRW